MIDDNSGKINVIFGSERNQWDFKSIALVVLVGGDKQEHKSHLARSLMQTEEKNGVMCLEEDSSNILV